MYRRTLMSYDFIPLDVNESADFSRGAGDINAHAEPDVFLAKS